MQFNNEITNYIPHRGKMLLLDKIVSINTEEKTLTSEVYIKPTCIFFDSDLNGIPSWVSFEYMAQSISAFSFASDKRNDPKPGVILSVSNLISTIPFFPVDSKITITIKEEYKVAEVFTFNCKAYINENEVVSCKLLVMETDSLEKNITKETI